MDYLLPNFYFVWRIDGWPTSCYLLLIKGIIFFHIFRPCSFRPGILSDITEVSQQVPLNGFVLPYTGWLSHLGRLQIQIQPRFDFKENIKSLEVFLQEVLARIETPSIFQASQSCCSLLSALRNITHLVAWEILLKISNDKSFDGFYKKITKFHPGYNFCKSWVHDHKIE